MIYLSRTSAHVDAISSAIFSDIFPSPTFARLSSYASCLPANQEIVTLHVTSKDYVKETVSATL